MKICYSCFSKLPAGAKVCPRCGAGADLKNEEKHVHALPCGTVLNRRYIVGHVLGQGGFGITYAGWESKPGKLVAIKEYFPAMLASRDTSRIVIPYSTERRGDFEYGKNQFLDEAKTLAAFIGSPNIVRVYSCFEENGTAYFVMEYVRGKSLRQYVESRGGRISWEEAWRLLMPVADALTEIHAKRLIHRDIKPENIIITKDGKAKLIDFGAARYNSGEKSSSLTAVLTPGYAPWEQYFSKGEQGPWTDVYAFAATMYLCITGKTPPDSAERIDKDSLEKPSAFGISIPDYAERALMKALAVKKEDRFQTTYDFRNEVLSKMEPPQGGGGVGDSNALSPEMIVFKETLKMAVNGDPEAQYMLGSLYEMGKGVRKDEEEAVKWYRKAAEQRNDAARRSLERLRRADRPRHINKPGGKTGQKGAVENARSPVNPVKSLPPERGQAGKVYRKAVSEEGKAKKTLRAEVLVAIALIVVLLVFAAVSIKSSSERSEKNSPVRQDGASMVTDLEKNDSSSYRASDEPVELTDTWEEIIAASKDGTYRDRYRIGDRKELDMGSEGVITMELVAMDEDELADGSGKAPMTWVAGGLLNSEHSMNLTKTNKGGWEASGMRIWLRETVLPLMPEKMRREIKEVTKYSYSYEEGKGVTTTDTIWIPSVREVFLADDANWVNKSKEKEGAAYTEVFKDDASRVRSRAGASGASLWWLRSAGSSSVTSGFNFVSQEGSSSGDNDIDGGGVIIGFCL